jgi:nucleotide-binding universal stress UspA family protein
MEIKRILVPHDGDQMSDKALMYAGELSRALNAEVVILHVIEEQEIKIPATILLGNDPVTISKAKRSIIRELQQKWTKFVTEKSKLVSSNTQNASSEVKTGDAAEEILRTAKESQVGLIVMGTRRLRGLSKVVTALGSVARKVSESAPCPVMLVH